MLFVQYNAMSVGLWRTTNTSACMPIIWQFKQTTKLTNQTWLGFIHAFVTQITR